MEQAEFEVVNEHVLVVSGHQRWPAVDPDAAGHRRPLLGRQFLAQQLSFEIFIQLKWLIDNYSPMPRRRRLIDVATPQPSIHSPFSVVALVNCFKVIARANSTTRFHISRSMDLHNTRIGFELNQSTWMNRLICIFKGWSICISSASFDDNSTWAAKTPMTLI